MVTRTAMLIGCLALAAPGVAQTSTRPQTTAARPRQETPAKLARLSIGVTAGGSATTSDLNQVVPFTLFAEEATIRETIRLPRGPRYEGHVGLRLWRRFGVGATVSYAQTLGTLQAVFRLPDPFLFSRFNEATGEGEALRTNIDVHVRALIGLVASRNWHIVAAVGPSVTWLTQQMGSDLFRFDYAFPFDAVTLTAIDEEGSTGRGIGANAGVSVTRRLWGRLGVMGDVRYSSTKAAMATDDGTIKVQTGGAQVSAGIRIHF